MRKIYIFVIILPGNQLYIGASHSPIYRIRWIISAFQAIRSDSRFYIPILVDYTFSDAAKLKTIWQYIAAYNGWKVLQVDGETYKEMQCLESSDIIKLINEFEYSELCEEFYDLKNTLWVLPTVSSKKEFEPCDFYNFLRELHNNTDIFCFNEDNSMFDITHAVKKIETDCVRHTLKDIPSSLAHVNAGVKLVTDTADNLKLFLSSSLKTYVRLTLVMLVLTLSMLFLSFSSNIFMTYLVYTQADTSRLSESIAPLFDTPPEYKSTTPAPLSVSPSGDKSKSATPSVIPTLSMEQNGDNEIADPENSDAGQDTKEH
ncbi:MAG: hypothetical protein LBL79_06005 [Prevotella sp.]|jgi:hypothetical protein|nr:hypothetical protein [Prevotella sp.]